MGHALLHTVRQNAKLQLEGTLHDYTMLHELHVQSSLLYDMLDTV